MAARVEGRGFLREPVCIFCECAHANGWWFSRADLAIRLIDEQLAWVSARTKRAHARVGGCRSCLLKGIVVGVDGEMERETSSDSKLVVYLVKTPELPIGSAVRAGFFVQRTWEEKQDHELFFLVAVILRKQQRLSKVNRRGTRKKQLNTTRQINPSALVGLLCCSHDGQPSHAKKPTCKIYHT